MASQFSEFWNYQQYYRMNANPDNYKEQDQNYPSGSNFYQNGYPYYSHLPYVKEEKKYSANHIQNSPESTSNLGYEGSQKYHKYGNQSLLQTCLENNISSPPNTPNSVIIPNEPKSKPQYNPARQYEFSEINIPQNYILDSPPKTPNSLTEVKPPTPEKNCDSPALRALLTRQEKNPIDVYKNAQKEIYANYYEKANYFNSGFCEQNSYDSNDCKEVLSPPMAIADGVNSKNAASSLGSTRGDEYNGQQNETKMAMADGDIYPWMKTGKGTYNFYLVFIFISHIL